MKWIKYCVLIIISVQVLCVAHRAWAGELEETSDEIAANQLSNQLLVSGQYKELDRRLNAIQHEYETEQFDDVHLGHMFRGLHNADGEPDPVLESHLNAWVAAFPNSYAAHEERASYWRHAAHFDRGVLFIAATPQSQIEK